MNQVMQMMEKTINWIINGRNGEGKGNERREKEEKGIGKEEEDIGYAQ